MEIHLHSTYLKTAKHQQNISGFDRVQGPQPDTRLGHGIFPPRSCQVVDYMLIHYGSVVGKVGRGGVGQYSCRLAVVCREPQNPFQFIDHHFPATIGVSPRLRQPQTSYSWLVVYPKLYPHSGTLHPHKILPISSTKKSPVWWLNVATISVKYPHGPLGHGRFPHQDRSQPHPTCAAHPGSASALSVCLGIQWVFSSLTRKK